MSDKKILDACCGSRMFWFDKNNQNVLYADKREGVFVSSNGRRTEITPDVVCDFTKMPFENESFHLVVLDPPHRTDLTEDNWMAHQYGKLFTGWEDMIRAGVDECMRVLKPNGVLIFKWNEKQIKTKKVVEAIGREPLFGHTTTDNKKTIWMTFMK